MRTPTSSASDAGHREAENLAEEDHRRVGAADAAEHVGRRLALDQRLRRHHDRGEREADRERRGEASPRCAAPRRAAARRRRCRTAPTARARCPTTGLRATCRTIWVPTSRPTPTMPLTNPNRPALGVQRVAHVDRDQRAEAADREQAGGHRDHEEQDRRVVDDERPARPSCRSRSRGCGCSTTRPAAAATPAGDRDRRDQARRHQEAEHVDRVAHLRRERRDDGRRPSRAR